MPADCSWRSVNRQRPFDDQLLIKRIQHIELRSSSGVALTVTIVGKPRDRVSATASRFGTNSPSTSCETTSRQHVLRATSKQPDYNTAKGAADRT